jgi:predicted transcriptional regulator
VEPMNVLLSIKPKYVEEILNGNKKYEFRKSIFKCKEKLEMIYIYSSSPVKKVVGAFVIESIIEDHPKVLWEKFKQFSYPLQIKL